MQERISGWSERREDVFPENMRPQASKEQKIVPLGDEDGLLTLLL